MACVRITVIWDGGSYIIEAKNKETTLGELSLALSEQLGVSTIKFCDFNDEMEALPLFGGGDEDQQCLLIEDEDRGHTIHIEPPTGAVISMQQQGDGAATARKEASPAETKAAEEKGRGGGKLTFQDKTCLKDVSEIIPGFLYVSGQVASQSKRALQLTGITHVLNCCQRVRCKFRAHCTYKVLDILDTQGADITAVLGEGIEFIDQARQTQGGTCLVHCLVGASRSVSVVLAYLMAREHMSLREAYTLCRTARKQALPNKAFCMQLVAFEKECRGETTMRGPEEFKEIIEALKPR